VSQKPKNEQLNNLGKTVIIMDNSREVDQVTCTSNFIFELYKRGRSGSKLLCSLL